MSQRSGQDAAKEAKRLTAAEVLVVTCLPLLVTSFLALLILIGWQLDFRPTDHPVGYWALAVDRIHVTMRTGGAAAAAAGACCVASLAVPHRLRTSGWAIVLLAIAGLLLAAVVLVGGASADMAFRISTAP